MSTTIERPATPTAAPPIDGGTVVLRDIPWSLYVALRDTESEDNFHVRMTYDRGTLELMAPQSRRHERVYKLISQMVQVWTEELDIPRSSGGQTTLRREDLKRGTEPDESFHIQHEAEVRAVEDLRLPDHPPPDLVIEADLTSSSVPRLPIFAALGIPEVWRWRNGTLQVLQLETGAYVECTESRVLPGFPFDEARRLLVARTTMNETELIRTFREHVRKITDGRTKDSR